MLSVPLSTTTDWDLFWRKILIHENVLRFIPKSNTLYVNKLWSTLSNALLKAIIMVPVCLPFSRLSNIFCVKFTSWVSQLCLDLMPSLKGLRRSLESKWVIMLKNNNVFHQFRGFTGQIDSFDP